MRKNLTKKLFLSVLTLAFAVISLGASTYAWFVLSEDAKIETFQGTVAAGTSGLEIQVTAKGQDPVKNSWSATSIKSDIIQNFIGNNVKFSALEKVALTNDGTENPIFESQQKALGGEAKEVTANLDYIVFDVHFRLADANKDATGTTQLFINSLVFSSEESTDPTWNAAKAYTEAAGPVPQGPLTNPYKVQDAARVGFVNGDSEKVVFEATQGSAHYTSGHNDDLGAIDYYNKVNEQEKTITDKDGNEKPNPEYISVPENYYKPSQLAQNSKLQLADIPNNGGHVTLTVYVWIEGWDNECINDIFNQILKVEMSFTISNKQ